jgi:ATP-dependent Clp protease protease subunit
MFIMPTIIEKIGSSEKYYDVPSRLFKDRIVLIHGEIDEETSLAINTQLIYLDSQNNEPIQMMIESPGGSVLAGLSIMDTMNRIKSPISTISSGEACSMGSFLLSCGTKGMRKSSKSCRIMLHSLSHGAGGNIHDTRISHKESEYLQSYLMDVLATNTGNTVEQIEKDTERDNWMSAQEALEYGLIDEII